MVYNLDTDAMSYYAIEVSEHIMNFLLLVSQNMNLSLDNLFYLHSQNEEFNNPQSITPNAMGQVCGEKCWMALDDSKVKIDSKAKKYIIWRPVLKMDNNDKLYMQFTPTRVIGQKSTTYKSKKNDINFMDFIINTYSLSIEITNKHSNGCDFDNKILYVVKTSNKEQNNVNVLEAFVQYYLKIDDEDREEFLNEKVAYNACSKAIWYVVCKYFGFESQKLKSLNDKMFKSLFEECKEKNSKQIYGFVCYVFRVSRSIIEYFTMPFLTYNEVSILNQIPKDEFDGKEILLNYLNKMCEICKDERLLNTLHTIIGKIEGTIDTCLIEMCKKRQSDTLYTYPYTIMGTPV